MTKRHFIALADHIRAINEGSPNFFSQKQIAVLADFCEDQNPRFNRELWLSYIAGEREPSGGKVKG